MQITDYLMGYSAGKQASGGGGEQRLQAKSAIPAETAQVITPDTGFYGLSQVTIQKIPDGYIVPEGELPVTENGSFDVAAYSTVRVSVESVLSLQEKSVAPGFSQQLVLPDAGYDGLSKVTVSDITDTIPNGEELSF